MPNLTSRSFLKLLDFMPAEITALLDLATKLKADKKSGNEVQHMKGKQIALIFEKPARELVVRLKWQRETRAHTLPILNPAAVKSDTKKA